MRKGLVIAMISIHLFGNTELSQLCKAPRLVIHFFQHHQLDPDINFFEFIAMHYGGDDGTTADDFEDNKLPCHDSNSHSLSSSFTALLKMDFPSGALVVHGKQEYGSCLLDGIPSEHVLLFLQPPRIA